MTILGGRTKQPDIFCRVTGFTSDFPSFIRVSLLQADVVSNGERDDDGEHEDAANESFLNLAGEDGEIDAFELKNILDAVFKQGDRFPMPVLLCIT